MFRPLAFLALCLATAGAQAADARAAFEAFTRGLQGLSGRFEQQVYDARGQVKEASEGVVELQAPRQFRWEYQQPHPQLIVADGDHIWVHDPDLEQVSVRIQSHEEANSPLAVLIDPAELDRQFAVGEGGHSEGLHWLSLRPRKEEAAGFESARLGFGPAGLVQMEIVDGIGQRTVIRYSQWRRNPGFAAGHFRFVPPEDADVVGAQAEAAQVIPLED